MVPTDTGASPPAHLPRAGDTVAEKYVVEGVVGAGGMGVVVAARHLGLGTRVALKFLRGTAVTEELRARFRREAQAAASIRNEHVARVLDTGILEGDTPYMVMDLLEGRDLGAELAARGRLSLHEAADCVIQACDGLAAAHARGIVHRDIKPSNLFLCRLPDGATILKVLDFGISKASAVEGDEPTLTHTATILGSPSYMSPEQIRHAKGVDARTDVWSLGVVLHQLLTGVLPFRGDGTSSTLASVMVDEPESVRATSPELPAAIDDVLARCLQKNPGFRLQSVRALAEALAPHASEAMRALVSRMPASTIEPASPSASGGAADGDATLSSTFVHGQPPADTQAASVIEATPAPKRRARNTLGASLLAVIAIGAVAIGVLFTRDGTRGAPSPPAAQPTIAGEPSARPPSFSVATSAPVEGTTSAPSIAPIPTTTILAPAAKTAKPKWTAKPTKPPPIVAAPKPPPVAASTPPPASTLKSVLDGHK